MKNNEQTFFYICVNNVCSFVKITCFHKLSVLLLYLCTHIESGPEVCSRITKFSPASFYHPH